MESGTSSIKFAAAYAAMCLMGANIQLLTPISGDLKDAMGLSFTQVGVLMGIVSLPGIFASLPAGKAGETFGRKAMLIAGIALLIPGAVLFPLFRSYEWSVAARIFAGTGCSLISVFAPGLAGESQDEGRRAAAMGIFNTALPAGSILTLTFYNRISGMTGLFESFYVAAVAAAAVGLLVMFTPSPGKKGERAAKRALRIPAPHATIPISAAVLFANFASMGYVTTAPLYFRDLDVPWSVRGTMLSAPLWGAVVFAPIAGKIIERTGRAAEIMIAGMATQGIGLIATAAGAPIAASLAIFSVGAGIIMTPVYVILPQEAKGETDMAFAFMISAMMIGCLTGPYISGVMMDMGGYMLAFTSAGIFSIAGVIPLLFMKRQEKGEQKNK